ncbi:LytR/AlgR family response regulator transcription factor [Taibaiella koreensis]|uniref:LytR/AlgR family response regulator transcription factor n=1 Tax=Taibaiella koreensis TaxID=1268548 RepID=UPI000E59BE4D|nr:LytTR family DNA-binding domain-containing protein [Taibaiella koreensis]
MFSALILDDEAPARKFLHGLLAEHCTQLSAFFLAGDIPTAARLLQENEIDILFLDVNLGTETGFDLLQQGTGRHQALIFVTAHEEFSLKAIKARAIDYLLKPIDIDELLLAVDKATGFLKSTRPAPVAQTPASDTGKQQVIVNHDDGFELFDQSRILFAEAEGSYTAFYLEGAQKIIASRQLGSYETLLASPFFFRSHKSYIINLRHLKGYSSKNGYTALLSEGYEVPVSRRKLSLFLELSKKLGS